MAILEQMTAEPELGKVSRPLLRYHGGKWNLAPWILEHMPDHSVYVEPFGGAASVLLRKPRCTAEIYNDLDGEIVNLFRVIRDRGDELRRVLELTPYARAEFDLAHESDADSLEQARRTLVRSYMGFGGNLTRLTLKGRPERTGFRDYSKKNRGAIPAHDWKTWPEALPAICARLRGVVIECRPADTIIEKHDGPHTLHLVDPPYVHSARCQNGKRAYRHELDDDAHRALAKVLHGCRGYVMLCGYSSALYEELYGGWLRVSRRSMADGARARLECLWLNSAAQAAMPQPGLAI